MGYTQEREPTVLVDSHRLPVSNDIRLTYAATQAGAHYSVTINRSAATNMLTVVAASGKKRLGNISIDLARFNNFDAMPEIGVGESRIDLVFRFGEHRTQCFLNDDGRDRLRLEFASGRKPVSHVNSFKDCGE
jgi:hypothetical protein